MQTLLAQSFLSSPDALTGPGSVELWLNVRSGVTGVVLIAIGVVILMGPGRAVKRGWMVALGVMAVGAAVWVAGVVYESDREQVLAGAEGFFAAVEAGDKGAAGEWLGETVGVAGGGNVLVADGRGFVLGGIDRAAGAGLRELARKEMQGEVTSAGSARTQSMVRATFAGGGPNLVWVGLDWRKGEEGWLIRGLDILLVNGNSPGQAILNAMR